MFLLSATILACAIASSAHDVKYMFCLVVRLLCVLVYLLQGLFKLFGVKDFLPSDWIVRETSEILCYEFPDLVCENILFVIAGADKSQLNEVGRCT